MKWEYLVIYWNEKDTPSTADQEMGEVEAQRCFLNENAQLGWELIQVVKVRKEYFRMYFKRPLLEKPKQ